MTFVYKIVGPTIAANSSANTVIPTWASLAAGASNTGVGGGSTTALDSTYSGLANSQVAKGATMFRALATGGANLTIYVLNPYSGNLVSNTTMTLAPNTEYVFAKAPQDLISTGAEVTPIRSSGQ